MAETTASDRETLQTAITYEGEVRSTLLALGSNDPDADLAASHNYWKHCRDAGIDPEVAAATIYTSVRHRHKDTGHAQTATFREAAEAAEDVWDYRAVQVASKNWALANGLEYASNSALPTGGVLPSGDGVWAIYVRSEPQGRAWRVNVPTRTLQKYWHQSRSNEAANESPTREEWEVVVKRGGIAVDDITAAAGRRPSEVTAGNAIFGGFSDDEQATKFARKMTTAGYTASSGPRREYTLHEAGAAAEEGVGILSRSDWTRLQREAYDKTAKSHKGKFHGRPAVMVELRPGQTQIKTLDAMTDSELVHYARRHGVKDAHGANEVVSVPTTVTAEGDRSAMGAAEIAPVIHEPGPTGVCVPWVKVTRDADRYNECVKSAEKIGPIKTPQKVYELLHEALNKEDQEIFVVLLLNLRGELRGVCEVARGQRSRVTIGPADVLRPVLLAGAEGFVVAHNHPSNKCKPSVADRRLTDLIRKAASVYGKDICFIDHVIVAGDEYYSITDDKLYRAK